MEVLERHFIQQGFTKFIIGAERGRDLGKIRKTKNTNLLYG